MEINLVRTDSSNLDFQKLVPQLDADLAIRDGEEHGFYAQFNKIALINHVIVAFENETPVGCGAFKPFSENSVEIKRMFTPPEMRGRGIASAILDGLENWAAELGFEKSTLETGKKQPEAIALYLKNGYRAVPNFGQYIGVENSVCFEKAIS